MKARPSVGRKGRAPTSAGFATASRRWCASVSATLGANLRRRKRSGFLAAEEEVEDGVAAALSPLARPFTDHPFSPVLLLPLFPYTATSVPYAAASDVPPVGEGLFGLRRHLLAHFTCLHLSRTPPPRRSREPPPHGLDGAQTNATARPLT